MDKEERIWFGVLIAVFVLVNAITLSPLIPWQTWILWSHPTPDQTVRIEFENYEIHFPSDVVEVQAGEYVEFVATSNDVTYGFGVFRQDGTMVMQMQVVPGHENSIIWQFDTPGTYDVRSTEYSGPRHSEMFVPGAIRVNP
jgi:cytochrome c oxidase subunit 2